MFTVTQNRGLVRIHRATCTRAADASPIEKVAAFAAGSLVDAKPAACCKPNRDEVKAAVDAALAEATPQEVLVAREANARPTRKGFTPERANEPAPAHDNRGMIVLSEPSPEPIVEEPAPVSGPNISDPDGSRHAERKAEQAQRARRSTGTHRTEEAPVAEVTVNVFFESLARVYWLQAVKGGVAIAEVYGATAKYDRSLDAVVVSGPPERVNEAVAAIRAAWADAKPRLARFRKEDPHRDLVSVSPKAALNAEKAHLTSLLADAASLFGGLL